LELLHLQATFDLLLSETTNIPSLLGLLMIHSQGIVMSPGWVGSFFAALGLVSHLES